jgi:hypothetical protein
VDHAEITPVIQVSEKEHAANNLLPMATQTHSAPCDISDITSGMDTARSSHSLDSIGARDSCFEEAPAPTRFVRKQNKDCIKPRAFLGKSSAKRGSGLVTSHQPVFDAVGESTWDFVSAVNTRCVTSKFYVAHRQHVAGLLVSPESSLVECPDLEMWNDRLEALETL